MNSLVIFIAQYLIFILAVLAVIFTLQRLPRSELRHFLILCLVSLAYAILIDKLASSLIYNPRPFVVDGIAPLFPHNAGNGFPSNHSLIAALIAGLVWQIDKKRGLFLGILALAIGLARVQANVHHLIDIIGGILIAVVAIGIAQGLMKLTGKHITSKGKTGKIRI